MMNTKPLIRSLTVLILLSSFAAAQQVGQPITEDFRITYWNVEDVEGTWQYVLPVSKNSAGAWNATHPNPPAETLVTTHGLLELAVPTGKPLTIGMQVTQVITSTLPGQQAQDFGSLHTPIALPASHFPNNYTGANMWQHLPDLFMWEHLVASKLPHDPAAWTNALPVFGNGPSALLHPYPVGTPLFNLVSAQISSQLPPDTTGLNVIFQMAIEDDTPPLLPGSTRYLMSNSFGLQLMAAPPLKPSIGSQGNHGPAFAQQDLVMDYANISVEVQMRALGGTTIDVPTDMIDGSTVSFSPTEDSVSGPILVNSTAGPTQYEDDLVSIVTQGVANDLAVSPPTASSINVDGVTVWGYSFFGTADGNITTVNVPAYPGGGAYDLDVKVYALDRATNIAGFDDGTPSNANVPMEVGIGAVGAPITPSPLPAATPIGSGAQVRRRLYNSLTGPRDLGFRCANGTGSTFDYLMVVRAFPAGSLTVTP